MLTFQVDFDVKPETHGIRKSDYNFLSHTICFLHDFWYLCSAPLVST